jgi:hypothetical protein
MFLEERKGNILFQYYISKKYNAMEIYPIYNPIHKLVPITI